MDPQSLKAILAERNKDWLAAKLGVPSNKYPGIDLFNTDFGIELKSRYDQDTHKFTIHAHQHSEYPDRYFGRELAWAFMLYSVAHSPSRLSDQSADEISRGIRHRTVWLLGWDFVKQFKVSKTARQSYIYVPQNSFANVKFKEYKVPGAEILFQEGISLEEVMKRE